MPLANDRCICLKKTEYSETSQILQLFGREHGLLRVIAKGAHRRTKAGASKFDGGIDFLDLGDAVFTFEPSRELNTLTEWSLREGHAGLRKNLRAMYLSLYAAELVSMLIEEHDPHPELFDRLEHCLQSLGQASVEESFLAFEFDLLREAGYLADVTVCVGCGRKIADGERIFFSPSRGGMVCRDCEPAFPDRIEMDPRLHRLMQMMLTLPRQNGSPVRLPRLTRHQTDPINKLLSAHIEHTLGRRLRMTAYVL